MDLSSLQRSTGLNMVFLGAHCPQSNREPTIKKKKSIKGVEAATDHYFHYKIIENRNEIWVVN